MVLPTNAAPFLTVRKLVKSFRRRSGLTGRTQEVQALRGVDLELQAGQTLAIVGASGAGKSTLARCIAGLDPPDSGEVVLGGRKPAHREVQMIFQDPGASLNPRFTVEEALAEPIEIRGNARSVILDRLAQVGLPETAASRLTSQLSGGQKARLALARALAALDDRVPCVLILDESLASLDLSVQAQMINLLVDLQQLRGLAYILIAHDLSLAAHLADEVAVLHAGRIVERGAPHQLFQKPDHPHFQELIAATLAWDEDV